MENSFIQVLLYFIPAVLVLLACFLILKKFLDNEQKLKLLSLKRDMNGTTLPLRLQAYERLTIFLERIGPNNRCCSGCRNLTRLFAKCKANCWLPSESEFEHNLSANRSTYHHVPGKW